VQRESLTEIDGCAHTGASRSSTDSPIATIAREYASA
jgi:hypothetical protein